MFSVCLEEMGALWDTVLTIDLSLTRSDTASHVANERPGLKKFLERCCRSKSYMFAAMKTAVPFDMFAVMKTAVPFASLLIFLWRSSSSFIIFQTLLLMALVNTTPLQ